MLIFEKRQNKIKLIEDATPTPSPLLAVNKLNALENLIKSKTPVLCFIGCDLGSLQS